MKILIGTVPQGLMGGIFAAEKGFQDLLTADPKHQVRFFHFGSKTSNETLFDKIFGRTLDLVKYYQELSVFHPDVVHLNSSFDERALLRDVGYIFISRVFRVKLFIKYHGSRAYLLSSKSLFWRSIIWFSKTYTTAAGALSSEEKRNFLGAGYRDSQVHVIKNTVDIERFKAARGPDNEAPTALFISRFVPTKGLKDVIRAMRILKDRGIEINLICVGDGDEMEPCVRLSKELGLGEAVHFVGHVPESETVSYYLNSTFLVLPTFHGEGFSMVIFQSVAAGLPILTTKIRAAADYLKEPDNCLWVEAKNPPQIAECMSRLLNDATLRKSMSENNRALAVKFSAPYILKEYLQVYESLT